MKRLLKGAGEVVLIVGCLLAILLVEALPVALVGGLAWVVVRYVVRP